MSQVLYEKRGKIAYITLNRPEAMNALSREVFRLLREAWMGVRDDDEVWVAIITGAGDKAFCAGGDLKEISQAAQAARRAGRPRAGLAPDVIPMRGLEVWKPFIAAINGATLGGGLELAMACDIRIAVADAVFGLPEVKRSLLPGAGGTQRLPRLVPFGIALEMLLTGDPISAQEAYRLGLVNRVVPRSKLMPTAEALAHKITGNGPLAVRVAKEAAYRGLDMPMHKGLALERVLMRSLRQTEDAAEGPLAFAQKRTPVYKAK